MICTTILPCCPSPLLSGSALPPPPSLTLYIEYMYMYVQCVRGGGYGVLGLRQINTCRKIPIQVTFLDDEIWQLYEIIKVITVWNVLLYVIKSSLFPVLRPSNRILYSGG